MTAIAPACSIAMGIAALVAPELGVGSWELGGRAGSPGAAATALRVNHEQFMHALATVGTFAAGLQQAFLSQAMSKPLHGGHAADAGVLAAMAASKGVTGALDIIEGKKGFAHAMSVNPDFAKVTKDLGRDYHINVMTFKNHGCCGHTFAPIDGALEAQKKLGVPPEKIACVRVSTYRPALEVAGYDDPKTRAEAQFSLKYVVATALTHGSVRLAAFEDAVLQRSEAIAARASVVRVLRRPPR